MKKRLLFVIMLLSGYISQTQAQSILSKGDIAIVGLSSTNVVDEFTWVALANIQAGTVIYFSDAGYNRSLNQFMGTTTTAGAQDGLYRFTAQSNITAGATFTLNTSTSYVSPSPWLPITGTNFGNDTTLTLSNTGDQIMAFQSTDSTSPGNTFATTNLTMLYMATIATLNYASYTDTTIINTNSEKMSNLHPQLDHVDGTPDCFIQAGLNTGPIDESDNAVYRGTTSGSKNVLLTAISSLANWIRYDPATPDGSSYVAAPTTTGWTNTFTYTVTVPDTTAPTVAITSTSSGTINSSSFPITITFNESVTGFISTDITVVNGTLSDFSGSGTTYTGTITPTAEGIVTVNVAAGVANDAASNGNTVATQLSRTYDITRPTATITTATSSPTNTTGITFTITFSEPVTGFTLIDVLPSNATIYSFTGSGSTYTLKMDPASNGTSSISIPANGAIDAAGNTNTAVGQYNMIYDTVQPTVAVTSSTSSPTSSSFPVTITFSENVTGFDISDITVTNATLSDFSAVSGSVYTVTVSASASNTVSIYVDADKATDFAGNSNTGSNTFSINYIAPCTSNRIWIGTWIGGLPVADQPVIFLTDYTASSNLAACSLEISNGATVTFPSGYNLTITGNMLLTSGGKLVMQNNTNLIQAGTVNNNVGNITVRRNANMRRLDYVYWSSPVAGQALQAFSPMTVSTRFYTVDEQTNDFVYANPANSFSLAKGYLIRAPNDFIDAPAAPQLFTGSYTGVPNNGTITIPLTALGEGFNLIGNPYPSTVNADLFLADPDNQNIETLYFWAHLTTVPGGTNYATYNSTGAATPSNTIPVSATPNGFIQVGQGFMAKTSVAGNATFKNSMRAANNSDQFFRTANVEKNRIWLNLSDAAATTMFNQSLIGYIAGATDALDAKFDGKLIETSGNKLYTLINNSEYVIQGRSLPFIATDVVALGLKAATAGTMTISIDHVDGLFTDGQDIFLKDNLTGNVQNLNVAAYTFATAEGTFNDRFELVYQNTTLGIANPVLNENSVIVYKQNNTLNINAGTTVMAGVRIFDIRGRMIFEKNGINANTTAISDLNVEQQVLLVQITSADNKTVTKKVVY